VNLPVHLFSVTGQYAGAPVLIYSGGVDTYKMDLHTLCVTLAHSKSALPLVSVTRPNAHR
jgi:esterase FrsA